MAKKLFGTDGVDEKLEIIAKLEASGRQFHPLAEATNAQWQVDPSSLELLIDSVSEGDRSLETGCGYSTVALALAGTRHTAVSPMWAEQERVREFCIQSGISLDSVEFVLALSQDVLPRLDDELLDFVLIDGSHAFPVPFIDWYYTARRLRVGGLMMIDDTHIRTGEILRDFLRADTPRWRLVSEAPSLALFQKTAEPVIPGGDWPEQPFCARTSRIPGVSPTRWQELRSRVALRTRLRGASKSLRARIPS